MTLGGYWSVDEFDIKSRADKFCKGYTAIAKLKKDKGSVKRLEVLPSGMKKFQIRMEGFQISEWFKTLPKPYLTDSTSEFPKSQNPDYYTKLEGTMTIIFTEGIGGGRAIWTLQYEKISDDIKDTRFIIDTTVSYFKAMDERIFSNPN